MPSLKPKRDLTDMLFERLYVIGYGKRQKQNKGERYSHFWKCQCECGAIVEVEHWHLLSGHTKSCGCYKMDILLDRSTKHGDVGSKLYNTWGNMRSRCYNKNRPDYPYYGGRGITICKEWRDSYQSFKMWALQNGYHDGLTIERADNNKGYFPDNCLFATRFQQSRNKRNNIKVEFRNEERLLIELTDEFGLSPQKVRAQYHRGLNINEILERGGLRNPPLYYEQGVS
ncbi:hypothetical protein [Desulfosporosinus youngiae]|uniref:AP2 domain-containing protein n=1 Tax=Desulfosporosinus youngiae DSM 17734 TaxID=768710 RepID=H5XZU4_9FIRM|nr:hypothetical protein [Desulfosporosinus youngiae]EHQ88287.1 hypothetical protein DesyoDRAFT_1117 [Desulfosporosinus youngiae DSM 17734]EHQ92140.1 hypothetical protein DesyoDRAFT_5209 [Desulfosporosinus youngiae DSM 17734]